MLPERVKPIVDKASAIAELFRANDIPIYLVGGSVRDAVISRDYLAKTPDFDYTTPARPDLIEKILSPWADALWTQGKKFGTIACLKDGIRHEVTT
ncbi:MAG: CCA tRNA nucleotidyltransferase, partial [Acidimicrobiales bacterium]|nr:CCA tRNA nucleotidyltransferase [Acidimicrobiales bacterium]